MEVPAPGGQRGAGAGFGVGMPSRGVTPGAAGLALVGLGAHEVGGRYRPEAAGAHLLDHRAEPGAPVGVVVHGRLDEVAALELAECVAGRHLDRPGDGGRAGAMAEQVLPEREALPRRRVVEVAVDAEPARRLAELATRADPADGAARLEP